MPEFNHDQHMQKMKNGIENAISILQGLLVEETKEQAIETPVKKTKFFEKVDKLSK